VNFYTWHYGKHPTLDLFAREAGIKALRLLLKEIVPQVFEELIG
jgi:hypothetical protein